MQSQFWLWHLSPVLMKLFGELIALPIMLSICEGIVLDEINKLQKLYLSINVTLLVNLPSTEQYRCYSQLRRII